MTNICVEDLEMSCKTHLYQIAKGEKPVLYLKNGKVLNLPTNNISWFPFDEKSNKTLALNQIKIHLQKLKYYLVDGISAYIFISPIYLWENHAQIEMAALAYNELSVKFVGCLDFYIKDATECISL